MPRSKASRSVGSIRTRAKGRRRVWTNRTTASDRDNAERLIHDKMATQGSYNDKEWPPPCHRSAPGPAIHNTSRPTHAHVFARFTTGGGADNGATYRGPRVRPGAAAPRRTGRTGGSRLRRPHQRVPDARSMAHVALILARTAHSSPVGSSAQNAVAPSGRSVAQPERQCNRGDVPTTGEVRRPRREPNRQEAARGAIARVAHDRRPD